MTTILVDSNSIHVPVWVNDLQSFRRWLHSEESPESYPVWFLDGDVWVDMTKEQIFSHVRLKQEFYRALGMLAKEERKGDFFPDGLLLTNSDAELSGNPDGTFVATDCFREERVRLIEGADSGFVELEGSPDMVLEVVSDSSVEKDMELLRELYWKAGIREYWIADGRNKKCELIILRHAARGYIAARKSSGWQKSSVFGKSFRLRRSLDSLGHPEFTLDVR
jgi:Uma2 family endonuclease